MSRAGVTADATAAAIGEPAPIAAPRMPRRRRLVDVAWPVALSLVVFVLLWQAVVFVSGLPSFVLPGPWTVLERFVRAWSDGTMWPHVAPTLVEILLGFAIGASVALAVGRAPCPLAPRGEAPHPLPRRGAGHAGPRPGAAHRPLVRHRALAKVVICALIVFFPVAVATMVGIRSVDARLLEIGRAASGRRRWQVIDHASRSRPRCRRSSAGMRVGVTLAVIGAIVGEWAGGEQGPRRPHQPRARARCSTSRSCSRRSLTIALVGIALYLVIVLVERRLVGVR